MAVHRACGTRDPIPYPRLESDDNFAGKRAEQVDNKKLVNKFQIYYLIYIHRKCHTQKTLMKRKTPNHGKDYSILVLYRALDIKYSVLTHKHQMTV